MFAEVGSCPGPTGVNGLWCVFSWKVQVFQANRGEWVVYPVHTEAAALHGKVDIIFDQFFGDLFCYPKMSHRWIWKVITTSFIVSSSDKYHLHRSEKVYLGCYSSRGWWPQSGAVWPLTRNGSVRGYGEHARPQLVKRAAKARALQYSAGNIRVHFVVKGLKKQCSRCDQILTTLTQRNVILST